MSLPALPAPRATALAFGPDGRLWTASGVRVTAWAADTGREALRWDNTLADIVSGQGDIRAVAPGRSHVLLGGEDGLLRLLAAADGRLLATVRVRGGPVRSLVLGPNEDRAVVGTAKGLLHVVDLPGGRVLSSVQAHDDRIDHLAWEGDCLASAAPDRTVRLWHCTEERLASWATVRLPVPVQALAFRPSRPAQQGWPDLAVVLHDDRAVRLWRLSLLRERLGG